MIFLLHMEQGGSKHHAVCSRAYGDYGRYGATIQPISDFRKGSARILRKLKETHRPIILTQRGRSVAVLINVDTYEKLDYERSLRQSFERGVHDIEQGRWSSNEQMMKEMGTSVRKTSRK